MFWHWHYNTVEQSQSLERLPPAAILSTLTQQITQFSVWRKYISATILSLILSSSVESWFFFSVPLPSLMLLVFVPIFFASFARLFDCCALALHITLSTELHILYLKSESCRTFPSLYLSSESTSNPDYLFTAHNRCLWICLDVVVIVVIIIVSSMCILFCFLKVYFSLTDNRVGECEWMRCDAMRFRLIRYSHHHPIV